MTTKYDNAIEFLKALHRQILAKSLMKDGINHEFDNLRLVTSISEELGEVASEILRGRNYSAVCECLDVAHSALLLAIAIDKDGSIIKSIYNNNALH